MAVDLETYVSLHESSVTHQAHEMVYDKGSPHWYTKVRTLSNKHASTLVLLFFVDSEAYDTVLKLSGMPRTMYLPHLIAQSTFDLFVTRKFSMHELVMVAKAIVRLNHAVEWAVLRGLETRRLASSWLPNPMQCRPVIPRQCIVSCAKLLELPGITLRISCSSMSGRLCLSIR